MQPVIIGTAGAGYAARLHANGYKNIGAIHNLRCHLSKTGKSYYMPKYARDFIRVARGLYS